MVTAGVAGPLPSAVQPFATGAAKVFIEPEVTDAAVFTNGRSSTAYSAKTSPRSSIETRER